MNVANEARRRSAKRQLYPVEDRLQLRSTATLQPRQASLPAGSTPTSGSNGGLSSSVKRQIGLAVGIPLGVILLVSILLYWLWHRGKAKQREVDDEQYNQRRKTKTKKSKTTTGSSTRTISESMRLQDTLPSPDTAEPTTALPTVLSKDLLSDNRASQSSHSILGDLRGKVSFPSLTHKNPGSRSQYDEKADSSGGLDRHPSNSSSRTGQKTPSRRPSQRELYYQNMQTAQAKGELADRSASPVPAHVMASSIARAGSPTASSIRGDPDLSRPITPGFSVAAELARHDAHLRLLEDRRMIAERYGQLVREQEVINSRPQTSATRPGSAADQYRSQSPLGGPADRGRGHARIPSRQNIAQQAYQNQFYQTVPTSSPAPTASHNLDRSMSPQPLQQYQQSRHQHQASSSSLRPRTSASPTPYLGPNIEKALPDVPSATSSASHSRGQSNPTFQQREAMTAPHRRARSHEQGGVSRTGGRGSVRAALNELRSQGIALSPSPAEAVMRSPSASGTGRREG